MQRKLLVLLIVGSLFAGVGAASHPRGNATEADPYCEPNQPPIAYDRVQFPTPLPPQLGGGTSLNRHIPVGPLAPGVLQPNDHVGASTCEGEHWDGQDAKGGSFANNPNDPSGNPCTGQDIDASNARYNFALWECADPTTTPAGNPLQPVGLRVTAQGDNNRLDYGTLYVAVRIFLVGRTAVFAEGCRSQTGIGALSPVLTPDTPCDDGTNGHHGATWAGRGTLAWYGHDDTPFNLLATVISAARLTQGEAGDGDCSQAEYAAGTPTNPNCKRDNTAITIDLLG